MRRVAAYTLAWALGGMLHGCGPASDEGGAPEAGAAEAAVTAEMRPAGLPNPYEVVRNWGESPPGRTWGRVSGVGLDPDGEHLWVAERCGGDVCIGTDVPVVLRYAPDGTLTRSFGGGIFMRPHGLHVDSAGNVWVTDVRSPNAEELGEHPGEARKGHQVVKFDPEGHVLLVLGTPGEAGDPAEGRLNQPNDVVTAPNGDIYVSEGHSGGGAVARISRFAADGAYLGSWGEPGEGPGQFRTPHALALDGEGRLYVADRGNSRVQVFDLEGRFLTEWRGLGRPSDVFVTGDGRVLTVDYESGDERNPGYRRGVYIGDLRTGEPTAFIPAHPRPTDPLGTAGEGIVMAADGSIYAGEVVLGGMTKYMLR